MNETAIGIVILAYAIAALLAGFFVACVVVAFNDARRVYLEDKETRRVVALQKRRAIEKATAAIGVAWKATAATGVASAATATTPN